VTFSTSSLSLPHSEYGLAVLLFLMGPLNSNLHFTPQCQIRQETEEIAASMVVVATAKSTKLEAAVGVQEETAIQQDQMHLTHEQVMTSCWCESHPCITSPSPAAIHVITALKHLFSPQSHGPLPPIWLSLSFLTLSFSLDCY
jgi:hypothetical protein